VSFRSRLKVTNVGDGPVQPCSRSRARRPSPSRGREGLQDRAAVLHARWRSIRPDQAKQTRRFVVVLRSPSPNRSSAHHRRGLSGRPASNRQSAAGVVGKTPARLSWNRRRSRLRPYSEFRDERFSAAFGAAAEGRAGVTVAYVVRAVSPRYVLPQPTSRHVSAGPFRPHRHGKIEVAAQMKPAIEEWTRCR